jgi:hypothetical protein
MPRVLGHHSASSLDLHVRVRVRRLTSFAHDPSDRRGSQAQSDSGQDPCRSLAAHCRKQTLQLSHEIPDEVRVAVDGLDGSNERSFPVFVEPTHPYQQRLQVNKEDPRRVLQGPARAARSCRIRIRWVGV